MRDRLLSWEEHAAVLQETLRLADDLGIVSDGEGASPQISSRAAPRLLHHPDDVGQERKRNLIDVLDHVADKD